MFKVKSKKNQQNSLCVGFEEICQDFPESDSNSSVTLLFNLIWTFLQSKNRYSLWFQSKKKCRRESIKRYGLAAVLLRSKGLPTNL